MSLPLGFLLVGELMSGLMDPVIRLDDRNKQRNSLSEVYFGKTKDIVAELRSIEGSEVKNREHELRKELLGAFGRRAPVS